MNDKDVKCLSDLKLKAEIKAVGKMIDRSELAGIAPTDKVVELMGNLTKEVERRANPESEPEPEPQAEESK